MQLIGNQKTYGIEIFLKKELNRETKKSLFLRDIEYNNQTGLINDIPYDDCTYLLEIHISKPNILAIEVDNRKKISRKSSILGSLNQVEASDERVECVYQKRVRVVMHTQLDIPITTYPENHFKIVENDDKGNVTVYEIAIISDNGLLFLTFQKVREFNVYNDQGTVTCPMLDAWDSMHRFVEEIYTYRVGSLPIYDQKLIQEKQLEELSSTNRLIVKIKEVDKELDINLAVGIWFNFANRFGMVATRQGLARVHFSQITRSDNLPKHTGEKEKFIYDEIIPIEDSSTRFKREVRGLIGPLIT